MEPLLNRLDKNTYEKLMMNSFRKEYMKNTIVFSEGTPAEALYFIKSGTVRIYKGMGADKEITIFTRKENDCFGEIGIFSGTKYSNTAIVTQDAILYRITKAKAEELIKQDGSLGLHFTRWVAESLEASKAKIRDYIAFGSEAAIASVFIRYSNMYGIVTKKGIRITEPIRVRDISKHIGISRETVSRVVNKWKEQGIIINDNKFYLIKDINYFRKLLLCENCGVENCVL
ncbi:Crp/Fnr family transcriptional regulator [Virgibacillus halodenitrificans]|uniref:Crp/Fnr family transcriptional regulator n=1 Tax=Virgibacillus halodenitrificans TaxID=1482 RepID=UPI001FB52E20|nr:Crp/Fnr family transcriptional regulator [Virgibacillus halodenitrificans]MCJ0932339.1 Crp/Fnr family transcriptional regulator [Virgibacillus halodenitrificans]